MPRGMTHSTQANTQWLRALRPTAAASAETHMLYDAHLAAETVVAARNAEDAMRFAAAETRELLDAHFKTTPADGSMGARPVAVTLIATGLAAESANALSMLDALAHLHGSMPRQTMRATVLTGVDARAFVDASDISGVLDADDDVGRLLVLMRWAELVTGWDPRVRTEVVSFDALPLHASQSALEVLQSELFGVCVRNDVPIDAALLVRHAGGHVRRHAWLQSIADASAIFFALTIGKDSVTLDDSSLPVPDVLGMFVRISTRAHGEGGLTNAAAFHGMLLGSAGEEVNAFCDAAMRIGFDRAYATTDGRRRAAMRLHTCAVQATGLPLEARVTLYDRRGCVGEPIRSPGSWIWQHNAAIVPISHVLTNFVVTICSYESMLPGRHSLRPFFVEHFHHASRLYASAGSVGAADADAADASAARQPGVHMQASASSDTVATLDADAGPGDGPDAGSLAADAFVVGSLGLAIDSRRASVGDVYAHICDMRERARVRAVLEQRPEMCVTRPSDEVARLFKNFVYTCGVGLSVREAFDFAANAVLTHQTEHAATAARAELARLRRVADGALAVGARARRRLGQEAQAQESQAAPRLVQVFSLLELAGCGIVAYVAVDETPAVVGAMQRALAGADADADAAALAHACDACDANAGAGARLDGICAATDVLAASTRETDVFVVDAVGGEARRVLARAGAQRWREVSAGALLDAACAAPRAAAFVLEGGMVTVLARATDRR